MLGKTHQDINTIRPLKDGVIADFEMTDAMLRGFIRKINMSRIARPRIVICIPSGITEVEKRAVRDSADRANAREVFLVEEPIAAAIGIEIDISKPIGNIIVDIGGGTTEIAVIALNGIVTKQSIRVAGDEMDDAIIQYFKSEHNLLIGERTAERIKCTVGSAMPINDTTIMVKGRSLVAGIPKTIEVSSVEIRECLKDTVELITQAIKQALEMTPPELSSDILDRGIILTGGGAQLKGLDQRIRVETDLPVNVAEDPLLSVVKGTGVIVEDVDKYKEVLV
jgi:rod shape-determining protein MreB